MGTPSVVAARGPQRARPRRIGRRRRPASSTPSTSTTSPPGSADVLTDDAMRADLAARGTELRAEPDVACGGPATRRALERSVVSQSLALSLDVSAVPERPGGAGYYTMALCRGLAGRADVALTLLARRNDERRWADLAGGAAVRPAGGAQSRPGRLVYEQIGVPVAARSLGVACPPRPALHDARTVPGALRGHDPRLHLLRPPRVASPVEGGLLPPGHPAGRTARGRAHLREPGHSAAAARLRAGAGPGRRGAARGRPRIGSRPDEPSDGADRVALAALGAAGGRAARSCSWARSSREKGVAPLIGAFDLVAERAPRRRPGARRPDRVGDGGDRARAGLGPPCRPDRPDRLPVRRGGARAVAPCRGRGLPGARRGIRPARPGGAGLRGAPRDDAWHRDGGNGRRVPLCSSSRAASRRAGRGARGRRWRRARASARRDLGSPGGRSPHLGGQRRRARPCVSPGRGGPL